jgi:hypothetical protein
MLDSRRFRRRYAHWTKQVLCHELLFDLWHCNQNHCGLLPQADRTCGTTLDPFRTRYRVFVDDRYWVDHSLSYCLCPVSKNCAIFPPDLTKDRLSCEDRDLGMATLLLGAVRAIGGSVAVTIYSALLNNTLEEEAAKTIEAAVFPFGLPEGSYASLILNLINENIPAATATTGVTPQILQAARTALKVVWTHGFHKVYTTSASFAAAALIAALLSKDVSHNMTNHISARLENDKPAVSVEEQLEEKPVALPRVS